VPFPDLRALRDFYGVLPHPPVEPFQFFMWEILSADALPARRDLAWQALRRLPALTPDAVFRTPSKTLLDVVGLIGSHRDERVEHIRATTGEFKRHRDLFDPEAFTAAGLAGATRALRRLTHLPRETLDRALLYAGGYAVLPLDDASARVVARLEGTAIPISGGAEGFILKRARWAGELRRQRRRSRKTLAAVLPRDVTVYREALVYLRHHAQHTCIAVGPHCKVCPLAKACVFVQESRPAI
jgi:endonuclease III